MKLKFVKKVLAVLCVATMSMSCVAGSVGAINFVPELDGVDVEKTQEYVKKLNNSIQKLNKKLSDCKDLIELKLGEKQLDEPRRVQLKQQLKLRDEQNKRNELKKQKLREKEEEFGLKESSLNKELLELQQKQNQIYQRQFNLEEMRSKQDISKEKIALEKQQTDFDSKFRKFENKLGQYGRIVEETYKANMDEGNSVTYEIVLRSERPERAEKLVEVTLEGYDVVEKNRQQINLLKSLKPQIDKWMDLIEKLDNVKFVKAIQLDNDLCCKLDQKASNIDAVFARIKEGRFYEDTNKEVENNYNDLLNTITTYLDEFVILSGNNDTNSNLRERKEIQQAEIEKKRAEQPIEKLGPTPKKKVVKKKVVKKKVIKKKSLDEHNKNLDNILNQMEELKKEIQQAENFKLDCLKCYKDEIDKLNQKIQNLRQSRESAKSVEGNKGIKLRNGIFKDIKAKKAEKLKLKAEMEKNIANLEKQIQDKKTKKADLEKQLSVMLK